MPLVWVGVLGGGSAALGWRRLSQSSRMCIIASSSSSSRPTPAIRPGLALKAFAHGGLTGVGPGAGTIKYRIPDAHSDFIFAVAGEEFGFVLCGVIALLFCVLTVRLLLRSASARDPFCAAGGRGPGDRHRPAGLHQYGRGGVSCCPPRA